MLLAAPEVAMDATHWTLVLAKQEHGGVVAQLLEETHDGLDLLEVAQSEFGPFDTCKDITDWLCRQWSPRARLPLR